MNNLKRLKGIIFLAALMAVTAFTWAITHKAGHKQVTTPAVSPIANTEPAPKAPAYNKAILQKFEAVCQAFNMQKPVFTCLGIINIVDGADSSKTIRNLDFTMCKNGNNCFYQFGHTEILNARGMYICIENDQKRVIAGRQKSFIEAPMPDISQIGKILSGDYYNLTDTVKGKNETIAFVNENHITCKEYAITFDTLSKKVNRVFTRLTNIDAPERKDREKTINITISECTDAADPDKYLNRYKVVQKAGNGLKLTEKYTGYELINL